MQKIFLMRGLNSLCAKSSSFSSHNPHYKTPSLVSFAFHNLYTSKSESSYETPNSHHPENEIQDENPVDVEDVSSADLKTQIDKFYKGDVEAIPAIFESILKRKLSGKHEESDDELMNEFRHDQTNEVSNEEINSDSYSDTDSDSDE
ncbi:unnamed protein product [Lactuca virosa]|uniref:Uncharacterized protein n=1 Tax=Lactuca virosa TaxID=75947 RepID=A0AAU9P060_9ASTR|nr:unnamed protein product [Lactuca virosa]